MTNRFAYLNKYDALRVAELGRRLIYSDLKEGAKHAPKPTEATIFVADSKGGKIATDDVAGVQKEFHIASRIINRMPTISDTILLLDRLDFLALDAIYAVPRERLLEITLK